MGHAFEGHNEVDPGPAGTVRTFFGAFTPESKVTAWEPNKHLAHRTETAPRKRFAHGGVAPS